MNPIWTGIGGLTAIAAIFIPFFIHEGKPKPSQYSGSYEGSCHNETHNLKSRMILAINEDNGQLSGSLVLDSEDLGGGAQLKGVLDGATLTFTTDIPESGQIMWTGKWENNTIRGVYIVEHTFEYIRGIQAAWDIKLKEQYGENYTEQIRAQYRVPRNERGTWEVKKY